MKLKSRNRSMPPSRALLATMKDGKSASATWVNLDGRWRCFSASKPLRWLRGYTLAIEDVPGTLDMISKDWNWITPQYGRAVEPPFKA